MNGPGMGTLFVPEPGPGRSATAREIRHFDPSSTPGVGSRRGPVQARPQRRRLPRATAGASFKQRKDAHDH